MTESRRGSLADQAAAALLDRIRGGEWELGQRLPGETTLAPQLGVGRSTVREAIHRLAGRGVLVSRQGAGVFVTAMDAPEEWNAVLHRSGIAAVLEARIAIETEACRLAGARRTPQDLRAIGKALATRHENRHSAEALVDADLLFHRQIVVAAHSAVLREMYDGLTPQTRRAMLDLLRADGVFGDAADHHAHVRMAEAIRAHDGDAAADLSRAHLSGLRARLA